MESSITVAVGELFYVDGALGDVDGEVADASRSLFILRQL
jgi:hypothetical protein